MIQHISPSIAIGMNARLFPANWRPIRHEIAFARQIGCTHIQVHGSERGADSAYFGESPGSVGNALAVHGLSATMEIVVRLRANGRTAGGATPLEVLRANLPAIDALGIRHVHFHFAPGEYLTSDRLRALEGALIDQLAAAAALARRHGFTLGLEHNEPDVPLFAELEPIIMALESVPDLGFVWDLNHTPPDELGVWMDLAPRMTLLHVSDTPLPEVNHHLPLGLGSIDFSARFHALHSAGYTGPAILEIGGVPKSGGFGRDTDDALADSAARLRGAIPTRAHS